MPFLDDSDVHWRYPYYDLEILDANGGTVSRRLIARCGNVNPFRAKDIVSLEPGEVFRTWVPTYDYELAPGKYRVRLKYTAKRDTTINGVPLSNDDEEVNELIKTVWEGTIVSNRIEVEILPTGRKK
jgi:hypothetical protein